MIFVLSRMSGDPRVLFIDEHGGGFGTEAWEKMGEEMGLDKPVPIQYAMWLKDILSGDFGKSLAQQQPVTTILKDRAGASIRLGVAAWIFGTLVGVPLGILSAINRGSAWDYIARTFALFGQSLPSFWSGIMGILIFAGVLIIILSCIILIEFYQNFINDIIFRFCQIFCLSPHIQCLSLATHSKINITQMIK